MEALKLMNLGVRFLLEIIALVIVGYWGFHITQGTIMKFLLGIGSPLVVAVIWGMFGAPKAPFVLSGFPFLLLEIVIFGLLAAALFFIGKPTLASICGLIVVINLIFMKIWHQ
ncbi:YrdB family protein [Neobacillus soli]|uniref:YrdB family protein n=1 Tax=Neobacillus soli TaxID=220688 RepID=UPI000ADFA902|nr:YrdB family protein [Neobacillus soli]